MPSFLILGFLVYGQALQAQSFKQQLEQALTLEQEAGQAGESGDVDAAIDKCRRAASQLRELGVGEQDQAVCWLLVGSLETSRGRYKEAVDPLTTSLQILEKLEPTPKMLAGNHLLLGQALGLLRQRDQAVRHLDHAEALFLLSEDRHGLWTARMSKAQIYLTQGRMAEALGLYEEAVRNIRALGASDQLAAALSGAGSIYRAQGRNEEASKVHQEALSLSRRSGNKSGEALALNDLANLDLSFGQWDQGLARLEESLAIRRSVGDRQGEALALMNSGHLLVELGRHEEALDRFEKSLKIAREIGDPGLESMNLQKLAQILAFYRRGEALPRAQEALEQARRTGDRRAEMAALKIKGFVLLGRNERRQALEVVSRALALSRDLGNPAAEAEILTLKAFVLLSLEHIEESAEILRKALKSSQEIGDLHLRTAALVLLGIAELKSGRREEAIQAYREAIQTEEVFIDQTWTDDLLQGFLGNTRLAHPQLIQLLVLANDEAGAFAVAEQARSRTLLRQLGNRRIDVRKGADRGLAEEEERLQGRLRDLDRQTGEERRKPFDQQSQGVLEYLARETDQARRQYENVLIRLKQTNPEYASLIRPGTLGLAEVQKLIDPETTLIEYFSLDEQLLVWVIERDSYRFFRLPVSADALAERITFLRNRIASREAEDGVSVNLYRHLFAPLEPSLHHENLVVVPHGALHSLPFAALLDEMGRPLIERYRITLLPSASVLPFLRDKRSPNEGRLLVLGDPDGSLTHARDEARAVAALYGQEPLLGMKAAESTVRNGAGKMDVLHLAAHAVYDPARPLFSRIELAPGDGEDGRLELHEVFNLDLTGTNLVVLSGCGTALGNPTGGDDLTGFTRAFLYAGAPSVLATLWPVDDEASSALMASFHRHLRQGAAPARALQAAQSEIAKEEKWRSPYYWAGYILTGDGG